MCFDQLHQSGLVDNVRRYDNVLAIFYGKEWFILSYLMATGYHNYNKEGVIAVFINIFINNQDIFLLDNYYYLPLIYNQENRLNLLFAVPNLLKKYVS
jgi:hypothetical protein